MIFNIIQSKSWSLIFQLILFVFACAFVARHANDDEFAFDIAGSRRTASCSWKAGCCAGYGCIELPEKFMFK